MRDEEPFSAAVHSVRASTASRPGAQTARVKQHRDERLQMVGAGNVYTSLPILDDSTACTNTSRKLPLG